MAHVTQTITREQAEQALAAVKQQFAPYIEPGCEPKLFEPGFHTSGWSIGWEEGPYEWTYRAFHGGVDEEMYETARHEAGEAKARELAKDRGVEIPKGVFPEPVNHWCLGLYPEW